MNNMAYDAQKLAEVTIAQRYIYRKHFTRKNMPFKKYRVGGNTPPPRNPGVNGLCYVNQAQRKLYSIKRTSKSANMVSVLKSYGLHCNCLFIV